MDVVVVGAGIAGLSCAQALTEAGARVRILERGRVVGGRLASRRYNGRYTDIGAAYLVADEPAFAAQVDSWHSRGLARPWTETLRVFNGPPPGTSSASVSAAGASDGSAGGFPGGSPGDVDTTGPMRWAAPGGLRTLAEDLATGLDVRLESPVSALPTDADAVVLAMPGPQALRLSPPAGIVAAAAAQTWHPVIAAVLTYPSRTWPTFHGAFVNNHPVLATLSDDGDRRGDNAPVLVAHSTAGLATRHLTDPSTAGPILATAVGDLLSLPAKPTVEVHRWTFAQPVPRTAPPGTVNPGVSGPGPSDPGAVSFAYDGDVWLCGDAFGRPRVQTAWLSGRAVAQALLGG